MTLSFPGSVVLVEVGPRDGLQSLERSYPVEAKVRMVEILAATGLPKIEVTGFCRPSKIPQLADARVPREVGRIGPLGA